MENSEEKATEKAMDNFSNRAVLVSLDISHWSGRCVDKGISDDVILQHNASSDSGSFSKRLIAKEYLSEIAKVNNEARKYYKENTMAWETGKRRLLPSKKITEFTAKMREFEQRHEDATSVFISNYVTYKNDAQQFLNGMYNPADYPDESEIGSKFSISYELTNIDSPDDFRCEIDESVKEDIKNKMKKSLESKYNESMNKLYQRIHGVIKAFNEKLSDENARFKRAIVDNIEDLVKILPDLNFMDDPKVTILTQQIQNDLCRFDPDQLRNDKAARKEAVEASASIMETMEELYA